MEDQIRAICREIMAEAAAKGDVEFVHDVTSALPSRVIGQLMGLPADDLPFIHRLAEMNTSGQDADYASDVSQGTIDMAMYAIQFAAVRRAGGAARRPHHAAARDRLQRPLHDRHRLRQLLRAARHRGQRHHEDDAVVGPAGAARPSRPARRAARRSGAHPGRGRGDPALREPAALLPAHGHRRHRAARRRRSRPATRS